MQTIPAFVQSNKALFEECLLAKDPIAHLQSIPDSVEKNLLEFLMKPHTQHFVEELKQKYSVSETLVEQLKIWKIQTKIASARYFEDINDIIEQFEKHYADKLNCPKPADFQNVTDQTKSQSSTLPSKLKPIPSLSQWVQQELKKKQDNIRNFTKKAIQSLGQQTLMKLKPANKQIILKMPQIFRNFSDTFVTKFFKSYHQTIFQNNKNYLIPSQIYYNLTKSQFMSLTKQIPTLVHQKQYLQVWIQYNYQQQLQKYIGKQQLTITQKNQKCQILQNVLTKLKKLQTIKTKPIEKAVLRQLLILDISRQEVDKQLFIQYCKDNPISNSYENLKMKQQKQLQIQSNRSYSHLGVRLQTVSITEDQLIKQTIQRLFKNKDADTILKQLQQYFEISKLNKLFAITRLSQGAKIDDYSKYLPINQLKQFKQSKQITILNKNPKRWKPQDQISLHVRVKNINKIHVKIYQLDLQKYYVQHNTQITQTQNLSHLHPNHCYDYKIQNNNNPYLIQSISIQIEGIPKQQGVWIIDLESKGLQSRAFIRKGAIAMVQSTKTEGIQLKFYNQSGSQVKNYKIWMEGKSHIVQSNFAIPFGESNKNLSLVVSKDGYSQRFDIFVPSQEYSLNISYIYNNQSFIVGSIARILLHPTLSLQFDQNMQVTLNLLQKLKIIVSLTNNLGIKSTIDIDNVKFKQNQDYLLQFPIQSYTQKIDISVNAKITKYNKKQQNLSNDHQIIIQLGEQYTNFIDLYMRKQKNQDYTLFILGKNGQPIPRTQLTIKYLAEGRNRQQSQLLLTATDGSVKLGTLKGVISISATVNLKAGSISRQWTIQSLDNQLQYVQNSVFMKDDPIQFLTLPYQQVTLWKLTDIGSQYSQNYSNYITQEEELIKINNLTIGRYILQFLTSGKIVNFQVVDGKKWQTQYKIFDEKKSILYQLNPHQNQYLSLGKAQFTKQNQFLIITIPLNKTYTTSQDKSLRAHLLISNFILPNFVGQLTSPILRKQRTPKSSHFNTKKSQYYNNKQLGQQISYTLNRLNQNKHVGNDLDKPRLFLKRIQVGETNQLEEQLAPQASYLYSQVQQQCLQPGADYMQNRAAYAYPTASAMKSAAPHPYHQYGKALRSVGAVSYSSQPVQPTLTQPEALSSFNNFLVLPGMILPNKKGDTLTFKVPVGYSHFQCYLFTKTNTLIKKYDYPIQQIKIKNLSHSGMEQDTPDTAWTMSRQVYKVKKDQDIKVGRDSIWSTIGLSNLVNFAKIKGAILDDWVINWSTYSLQQKYKIYDQKFCHQLNTYIKYNDPIFFKDTVQPFLSNKITKTFVDLCLLNDKSAIQYTEINLFKTLNQFEKVLLVQQLVQTQDDDFIQQAKNIVLSMENQNKSKRITNQQFKKQFDTVISAKLVQQAAKVSNQNLNINAQMMQQRKMQRNFQRSSGGMQCADTCYEQADCLESYEIPTITNDTLKRDHFVQPFKQMQRTKQYTQTTYSKLKQSQKSKYLIQPSPFWTAIANHFITSTGDFLSQNFMYLTTSVQFTLASCFIPNQKQLQYGLTTQDNYVHIKPTSSFLIFVKQLKSFTFQKKFGVLLNQRFFNPDDRYYYEEDGTQIEKQTQQFVVRKPYCIQTLITNTSGTKLELQLLIDIPNGSLPLQSHQTTQIQSIYLSPYSTLSYQRYFYFPKKGQYNLYPANACRGNSVIAKSQQISKIDVLQHQTIKKMDTLQNILKTGKTSQILTYLKTKNIFDQKIFQPTYILWMLKDKQFYQEVITILKKRKYYSDQIWIFSYYHGDLTTIKQHQKIWAMDNLDPQTDISNLQTFQYFPYYSRRTHQFLNENKSTIRNQQFKKTYFNFLFTSLFTQPTTSRARISFIYFLLLQDRIDDAYQLLNKLDQIEKEQHRLQFDYIECFIDMYKGYPTFTKARNIVVKYLKHPVKSWQKLFKSIADILKQYDSVQPTQQQIKTEFKTTIHKGTNLKISVPPQTTVYVYIYSINLQLYFSTHPFPSTQSFQSNTISNFIYTFQPGQQRDQKIMRSTKMKDCFVQVYQSISGLKKKKIDSFFWNNPDIKVKIKEDKGQAQVFVQNKRKPSCYCKVYQMKNGQSKFCRDGYTDITGCFKYALTDLNGVTQFAILFVTDRGSIIERVSPPSEQAFFA